MENLGEVGEVFETLLSFAVLGNVLRQSQPVPPPPPPPPPQVVVVERRTGERRWRQEPYREERRTPGSERRAIPPPAPAVGFRPQPPAPLAVPQHLVRWSLPGGAHAIPWAPLVFSGFNPLRAF